MYETFFKLSAKPFQLNPDPAFFYGSRGHRRAMAYLEYGLHQSEGFIVITGEVGAGKTTIVRSLLEQLDPAKVVAATVGHTQIDPSTSCAWSPAPWRAQSQPRQGGAAARDRDLSRFARSRGRASLLIIDEAQNLSAAAVEELRMLSNFRLRATHALLQSFLVGRRSSVR